MRNTRKIAAACLMLAAVLAAQAKAQQVEAPTTVTPPSIATTIVTTTTTIPPLPEQYTHGDCSWVPRVAKSVGWTDHEIPTLIRIIKRESGCCPRRIGGSVVDSNCNFIRMSTWTHPSDSGLLQINGVHWKQDHKHYHGLVCKKMGICEQEPLLDPVINLAAGRLLYDVAGWQPWSVNG
jgi:hypothetical protein